LLTGSSRSAPRPTRSSTSTQRRCPDRPSYSALATFHDPDGNAWLIQQVTQRLPGRVEPDITFASSNELAGALRRAAAAHGEHGKQASQHDANWPDWYADYIVREQVGNKPA